MSTSVKTRVCEICLEQRDEPDPEPRSKPAAVCAIDEITKDTEVCHRARLLNAAPTAPIGRPPIVVTAIANFSRPTENLESKTVSRAATSKTPTSATTVVASSSLRLLTSASASSLSGEASSTTPTPIVASRDFIAISPLSGVMTAGLPSGVVTASLPSGVNTASLPSVVKTAPPPSGVGTAALLSGIDSAALPFVVKTAVLLSGIETAALPFGVDSESEYAARQIPNAPPSIRVQPPSR